MFCQIHFFNNANLPNEKVVNPNLAITPSQMERLTREGKSIQMHSLDGSMFYDNLPVSEPIPLEYTRGIDDNDAWEASVESQKKLRKFKQSQDAKHASNVPSSISSD